MKLIYDEALTNWNTLNERVKKIRMGGGDLYYGIMQNAPKQNFTMTLSFKIEETTTTSKMFLQQ